MSHERLHGTLTLLFPREQHGYFRATVHDGTIEGSVSINGTEHRVRGSIDQTVALLLSLPQGDAAIQFGKDLENSIGKGTYLGREFAVTYTASPAKKQISPPARAFAGFSVE